MKENKKIGIYIPGRLKSERLPNKLILPLGDSCLWEIACKKLNALPKKYNKYVLCCDDTLIEIASNYENLQIIRRDKQTAEVDGPLTFIFKELNQVNDTHLMFLNPCLSVLREETILGALEYFENSNKEYGTSVVKYKNWLWADDKKNLTPIDYTTLSTKSIPIHYEAAHCFHIFNKKMFFETGKMLDQDLELIEIPKAELIDVDDLTDYEYAKYLHRNKKN
jgi:CMP-N-acetylneuraminic acid synthetase